MAMIDLTNRNNKTMQRRETVNNPTICGTPNNGGMTRTTGLGKLRLLAFAIGAQALVAQTAFAATLDHMSYTTLPDNQQQITFKLSEPVGNPQTFQIDHPAKIAIDFLDTTNALDKRVVPVGIGKLEKVSIVEASDRTRVVLYLDEMTGYQTQVVGDELLVTLEADSAVDSDAQGFDAEFEGEEYVNDELLEAGDELMQLAGDTEMPEAMVEGVGVEDDGLMIELPSSLELDYEISEEPTATETMEPVLDIDTQAIKVETGAPIEEYVEDASPIGAAPVSQPRMGNSRVSTDSGVDYSRKRDVFNPKSIK